MKNPVDLPVGALWKDRYANVRAVAVYSVHGTWFATFSDPTWGYPQSSACIPTAFQLSFSVVNHGVNSR